MEDNDSLSISFRSNSSTEECSEPDPEMVKRCVELIASNSDQYYLKRSLSCEALLRQIITDRPEWRKLSNFEGLDIFTKLNINSKDNIRPSSPDSVSSYILTTDQTMEDDTKEEAQKLFDAGSYDDLIIQAMNKDKALFSQLINRYIAEIDITAKEKEDILVKLTSIRS
tara:strand:+ start:451 stop:957 length:507 start_codon:yes stop_codon:yes gene_type:complete